MRIKTSAADRVNRAPTRAKPKRVSPTQRTLALLRRHGLTAQITEHWNPFARIRQDLFGFCDVLAYSWKGELWFVQTTSGANHAAREAKLIETVAAKVLCDVHNVVVVSWSKRGERGKRKTWTARVTRMTPTGFIDVPTMGAGQ